MPETIQEYENVSIEKKQGKKTVRRLAVDVLARLEKLKVKVGKVSRECPAVNNRKNVPQT